MGELFRPGLKKEIGKLPRKDGHQDHVKEKHDHVKQDATIRMFKELLTWWNGATIGARFDINRRGAFVGEDENGNRYFEERKPSLEGRKRRYVIYSGLAEGSRVSPDWHGWMHHTVDDPPTLTPNKTLKKYAWELPHLPNQTGTVRAYRPKGSLARGGERAASSADYEAWKPE